MKRRGARLAALVAAAVMLGGCLTREVWDGHRPHVRAVSEHTASYPVRDARVASDGTVAVAFNADDKARPDAALRPACFRLEPPGGASMIVPLLDRLRPGTTADDDLEWCATLQSRDRNGDRRSRAWFADVTVRAWEPIVIGPVAPAASPDAVGKAGRLVDALRAAGIVWAPVGWRDREGRILPVCDPLVARGVRLVGRLDDGGIVAFPAYFAVAPERVVWAHDDNRIAWSITERWLARRDAPNQAGSTPLVLPKDATLDHVHVDVRKRRTTWQTLGRIALTPFAATIDAAGILAIAWLESELDDDC